MSSESELVSWREKPQWWDKVNIEELEQLSAIGYSPDKIAMYFHVDKEDFLYYFNLVNSPLKYHYNRGTLVQQAKEGMTMLQDAATGENVTQAQRLDKLRHEIKFCNALNEIIFND